jgi:hypothetical protein
LIAAAGRVASPDPDHEPQVGFAANELFRLRPFAFHLTASSNLEGIRKAKTLFSASALLHLGGKAELSNVRRRVHESVNTELGPVLLRDQSPLHPGNLSLPRGWTFEQFVGLLNSRVFFWPGTAAGPISSGVRHFERYRSEKPEILRIPSRELVESNSERDPAVCKYNSGSPRYTRGNASPRSPETFVRMSAAAFRPSGVVELTFKGEVRLPPQTEIGRSPAGPWRRFFE